MSNSQTVLLGLIAGEAAAADCMCLVANPSITPLTPLGWEVVGGREVAGRRSAPLGATYFMRGTHADNDDDLSHCNSLLCPTTCPSQRLNNDEALHVPSAEEAARGNLSLSLLVDSQ